MAWSTTILVEYHEVLSRPKFKFSPEVVVSLLKIFDPSDQITPKHLKISLPDADDETFLAAAMATPDQVLITGNAAHFPANLCAPVRILTPSHALELLANP